MNKDGFYTDTIVEPQYNSEMKIGNITIYNTKTFNRFQKKMWKWCFGFDEINDIGSDK